MQQGNLCEGQYFIKVGNEQETTFTSTFKSCISLCTNEAVDDCFVSKAILKGIKRVCIHQGKFHAQKPPAMCKELKTKSCTKLN